MHGIASLLSLQGPEVRQAGDVRSVLTRIRNGHNMSIIIRELWIFNKAPNTKLVDL
jgi:hypothetical protein